MTFFFGLPEWLPSRLEADVAVAPPRGLPSERLSGLLGREEAEEGELREGMGLLGRE